MKKNKFIVFILNTLYLILYTPSALAQFKIGQPDNTGIKATASGATQLSTIVSNALMIIFIVGVLGFLVMFVWGAAGWILSGGEKEAIGKARGRITNALIGLALLALSGFIIVTFGQVIDIHPLEAIPLPNLGQSK